MLSWREEHNMGPVTSAVARLPFRVDALPNGELLAQVYTADLFCGRSKAGHVVSKELTGRADVPGVFRHVGKERTQEWFKHFFELRSTLMDDLSRAEGRLVQNLQIKDLEGLSLSTMLSSDGRRGIALVQSVLGTALACYPESVVKLVIVNAPSWFAFIWAAITPILNDHTRAKVRIYSGRGFLQELEEDLDIEVLRRLGYK